MNQTIRAIHKAGTKPRRKWTSLLLVLPLAVGLAGVSSKCGGDESKDKSKVAASLRKEKEKIEAMAEMSKNRSNFFGKAMKQLDFTARMKLAFDFNVIAQLFQKSQLKTAKEYVDCLLLGEQVFSTGTLESNEDWDARRAWFRENGCLDYYDFLNYARRNPNEKTRKALLEYIKMADFEFIKEDIILTLLQTIFQETTNVTINKFNEETGRNEEVTVTIPQTLKVSEVIPSGYDVTYDYARDFDSSSDEARASLYELANMACGDRILAERLLRSFTYLFQDYNESEIRYLTQIMVYVASMCGEGPEIPITLETERISTDNFDQFFVKKSEFMNKWRGKYLGNEDALLIGDGIIYLKIRNDLEKNGFQTNVDQQ